MKKVRYVREWKARSFVSDDAVSPFAGDEVAFRSARGYMWDFFSKWETTAPDGTKLASMPIEQSPQFVYGIEHTLAMVEKGGPEYGRALLDNMRTNGWSRVVQCAQGMLPADDKVIIDPKEKPGG